MSRYGGGQTPGATATVPAGAAEDLGLEVLAALVRATQDGMVVLDRHGRCVFANPAACTLLGYGRDELRGRDFLTGLGMDQPSVREGLAASAAGRPGRWEAVLRRHDGSELDIVCTASRLDGLSTELVAVNLQDDSERRWQAREAAALAQAKVAVSDSIEATVQSLAEIALRGTRALGVTVVLNDQDEIAAWIGSAGVPDSYASSLRASIRSGYRGVHLEMLMADQRVLVDNHARRRVESDPKRSGLTDAEWKSIPWQTAVIAPLVCQGALIGSLNAIYREDELPSEGEMAFLATLADQAAAAAMNVRLMADARDKVALEERQRLARELHDSVSQALYGIALGARTARHLLEHDRASAVQPIEYVLQLAEVGLAEMRALIFELRPELLETEAWWRLSPSRWSPSKHVTASPCGQPSSRSRNPPSRSSRRCTGSPRRPSRTRSSTQGLGMSRCPGGG